jgi:hypothetical protein
MPRVLLADQDAGVNAISYLDFVWQPRAAVESRAACHTVGERGLLRQLGMLAEDVPPPPACDAARSAAPRLAYGNRYTHRESTRNGRVRDANAGTLVAGVPWPHAGRPLHDSERKSILCSLSEATAAATTDAMRFLPPCAMPNHSVAQHEVHHRAWHAVWLDEGRSGPRAVLPGYCRAEASPLRLLPQVLRRLADEEPAARWFVRGSVAKGGGGGRGLDRAMPSGEFGRLLEREPAGAAFWRGHSVSRMLHPSLLHAAPYHGHAVRAKRETCATHLPPAVCHAPPLRRPQVRAKFEARVYVAYAFHPLRVWRVTPPQPRPHSARRTGSHARHVCTRLHTSPRAGCRAT